MWASGPATSPTAATATTITVDLPPSVIAALDAFAEDLVLPPLRPVRLRSVAPRGRDPRLLRHALARMRRA